MVPKPMPLTDLALADRYFAVFDSDPTMSGEEAQSVVSEIAQRGLTVDALEQIVQEAAAGEATEYHSLPLNVLWRVVDARD